MRLANLSPELRRRVAERRFDRFIEKHEGPWPWEYWLRDDAVEFLRVEEFDVLFPIEREHHRNVSILRCITGDTQQVLTIFLKDTTFDSDISAGRVAICEKMPRESWYLTTFYHEWYITDNY